MGVGLFIGGGVMHRAFTVERNAYIEGSGLFFLLLFTIG